MNILLLISLIFLISCSAYHNKEEDSLKFDPKDKEHETFFINAENEKFEGPITIDNEHIHPKHISTKTDHITKRIHEYKVVRGDTLGIIAVKIYGDFRRWKDLYNLNKDKLNGLMPRLGSLLIYHFKEEDKWIKPSGSPYLVVKNDNLRIISKKVYNGESKHWKYIWNNNKKLIYDPNLLFTGFTVYYLPLKDEIKITTNKSTK